MRSLARARVPIPIASSRPSHFNLRVVAIANPACVICALIEKFNSKGGSPVTATLTTLVNLKTPEAEPMGDLIADSNGDLFGTTSGVEINDGSVFEIVKSADGYATTPTILASFADNDGSDPAAGLIADANGDLFGTTATTGGAFGVQGDGTVFEIKKTPTGYASTPTTLVSFNGADGASPAGSLIADASGDLFGATVDGGLSGDGTVFEIEKTPTGYATIPTTLVSFNFADGESPHGGVVTLPCGEREASRRARNC
jgi:uncharacterized repeat protein (TIGR03803 family)